MEKIRREISGQEMFLIVREMMEQKRQVIFTVSGSSMLPFLGSRRDQVMVENCDREHLKKGDIILFQYDEPLSDYCLHRIYKVTDRGYQTMGDRNFLMDMEIKPRQVIGLVTRIYKKGKVTDCSKLGWKVKSTFWRWLRPFRRQLFFGYGLCSNIKRLRKE